MSIRITSSLYTKKEDVQRINISDIPKFKVCFEVIESKLNKYVKPYFDVDLNKDHEEFKTIRKNKKTFLESVKTFLSDQFNVKADDIAIDQTCRKNKISFHLIISSIKVKYNNFRDYMRQNKALFDKYHIDQNVYKSYQTFRITGCSKNEQSQPSKAVNFKDDLTLHLITNTEDINLIKKLKCKSTKNINEKVKLKKVESNKPVKTVQTKNTNPVTLDRLTGICEGLNVEKRLDNYKDWIIVMLAIYNVSCDNDYIDDGLDLMKNISRKSANYDRVKYETYKPKYTEGYDIYTLLNLLKYDDKRLYDIYYHGYETTYYKVKEEFEKDHIKIRYPVQFLRETDKELFIYNSRGFHECYNNKYYYSLAKDSDNGIQVLKSKFISDWLDDEEIRTKTQINFYPNPDKCPDDEFNLFDGLRVNNIELDQDKETDISLIIKHIKNLTGNNEDNYNYFIKWLAQIVQQPDELIGTAVVFVSEQGTGKNIFFDFLGEKVLGEKYFYSTQDTNHIYGRFAEGIRNKLLINLDEATGKDNFENSEKLKNLITAKKIPYEKKNVSSMIINNYARFIFSTNNETAVKVPYDDRRFFIVGCNNSVKNDKSYFKPLIEAFNNNNNAIEFYKFLMNIDIKNYDFVNGRPKTDIYKDMQEVNKPRMALFLEYKLMRSVERVFKIKTSLLFTQYQEWLKDNGFTKHSTNTTKVGRFLKNMKGIEKKRTNNGIEYSIDCKILSKHLDDLYNN